MKEFNTTGACVPSENYMVDLSDKVEKIGMLVDGRKYFTMNRARQYGKTTTLNALDLYLSPRYDVISIDFQDATDALFESESAFSKGLALIICDTRDAIGIPVPGNVYAVLAAFGNQAKKVNLNDLFRIFDEWCRDNGKPVVLIIDEVDRATDNQVFLDFLAKLRSNYLKRRKNPRYKTFQSVILAGVTDVKHLKGKIRKESEEKDNSPWNIAADFTIDMSLSETGIRGMLEEYESDHHTGMDTVEIAGLIRAYTNGYPFLVSRICQIMDHMEAEKGKAMKRKDRAWSRTGVEEAVKQLLAEDNTLFQSLTSKLNNYPKLKKSLRSILMEGTKIAYNSQQQSISQMQMYGFIRNDNNTVRIDNRIFETMLYNLFLSDEEMENSVFSREGDLAKNRFVKDGKLDMRMVLEGFRQTYVQVFGPLKDRFKEKDGRELFLLYLKPIINGTGNYYIEAQTRDQTRTDVIIDYLGVQQILELKIWRGNRYNEEGERQICEYLDYWNLHTGYMLSFNFNQKKVPGMHRVQIGDKVLFEEVL